MPEKMILKELTRPSHAPHASLSQPLVSFLCPTFGRVARRPHLINEMVYWFTRQEYPNLELLVLNDAPGQTIVCDTPCVNVINWPYKIATLGEKMNLLVRQAVGSVCVVSEDDDVSLPWRAMQAVTMLENADYWAPGLWWYAEEGKLPVADGKGVGHNCAAFRRSAFVGAYPAVSKGHDMIVHNWALANVRVNPMKVVSPKLISYFYRWGVSDYHLSGHKDMEWAYAAADPGPDGVYEIRPEMGLIDYLELHRRLTGQTGN